VLYVKETKRQVVKHQHKRITNNNIYPEQQQQLERTEKEKKEEENKMFQVWFGVNKKRLANKQVSEYEIKQEGSVVDGYILSHQCIIYTLLASSIF
jgi:hypothetical protein